MVGEQLQGDDFEQRREHFDGGRHDDDVIGRFARQLIAFGDDGDHDAVARLDFLDVRNALLIPRHGFRIVFVARSQHDDGKILIDQRVGAVLHFAGGIALGMNVGNFLELQRAFEGDGEVDAASEIQEIGVAEELPGQSLS